MTVRETDKQGASLRSPGTTGCPHGAGGEEPACQRTSCKQTGVLSLGGDDSLGEGMATYSRILAWRIPWTEEPVGLQSGGPTESDTPESTWHKAQQETIWLLYTAYCSDPQRRE